jgi:hypothetical protein
MEKNPQQYLWKFEFEVSNTPIQLVDDLDASSIKFVIDLLDYGALCPVLDTHPTPPPPQAFPENPS